MPNTTAARKTMSQIPEEHKVSDNCPQPALDSRYGQIGISAVAAAAQYQGATKNPAYAPTPYDWRLKYAEELA